MVYRIILCLGITISASVTYAMDYQENDVFLKRAEQIIKLKEELYYVKNDMALLAFSINAHTSRFNKRERMFTQFKQNIDAMQQRSYFHQMNNKDSLRMQKYPHTSVTMHAALTTHLHGGSITQEYIKLEQLGFYLTKLKSRIEQATAQFETLHTQKQDLKIKLQFLEKEQVKDLTELALLNEHLTAEILHSDDENERDDELCAIEKRGDKKMAVIKTEEKQS